MADNMKLQLILTGKDLLGKILSKDIGLLKNFKKEGEAAAKSADKLDAARKKSASAGATAANAAKKESGETKKLGSETEKAAKSEEKLNNARKKRKGSDGKTKEEIADKTKLAGATEKAAKAEEKLNNARKRGGRGRRSDGGFEEDLIQSGTGAGILWTAKKGMGAAMTKQEAMSDLYTSFYRSSLSVGELNRQMLEGEKIADKLGNKLPGTTATFLELFSTMKQRGIEATVILDGAGESAANLAVANKEDVQETGVNIARFGQMFNLKTREEYMNAADLMSRAKTTYGIGSAELMEAVKDFSGRTGKGLGLEGNKGAEDTLRYLSFLRAKTGLQGLTVGNAASSFFNQYLQAKQKKQDPTAELKKLTGVDLNIFDKKGAFLGLENAVKEFSKLKGKLSDEQQVVFGNKLAGEEGASIFQAMVKNGDQWGAFNQEMSNSMSLMDKSAKNAQNFTNKIEALTGSLENLGSAGFTPLLGPLGTVADKTNALAGYLTELAKSQPAVASTTAAVLTLGGAFLMLKGGSGLASRFLGGANGSIIAVGDNATKSAGKVGKLKNSLTSTAGIFKILLLMETIGFTWQQIENLQQTVNQWKQMNSGLDETGKQSFKGYQQTPDNQKNPKIQAETVLNALNQGSQQFVKSLDQSKTTWLEWFAQTSAQFVGKDPNIGIFQGARDEQLKAMEWSFKNSKYERDPNGGVRKVYLAENPWKGNEERYRQLEKMPDSQRFVDGLFKSDIQRVFSEIAGVRNLQNRASSLNDPNVMTSFRRDVLPTLGLSDIKKQFTEQLLSQAFPQSFAQSSQQLSTQTDQLMQKFAGLTQPSATLGDQFVNLNTNSTNASNSVNNFANATNNAAARINSLQFTPPTFAPIQVPFPFMGQTPPGRAKGGSMTKGHTYQINEIGQELFTPGQSGSMVANDILRTRGGANSAVYLTFNPIITVNSDSPSDVKEAVNDIKREFAVWVREIKEQLNPDRLAQKVVYSASRDAERS